MFMYYVCLHTPLRLRFALSVRRQAHYGRAHGPLLHSTRRHAREAQGPQLLHASDSDQPLPSAGWPDWSLLAKHCLFRVVLRAGGPERPAATPLTSPGGHSLNGRSFNCGSRSWRLALRHSSHSVPTTIYTQRPPLGALRS
jgi:hypothetical protein